MHDFFAILWDLYRDPDDSCGRMEASSGPAPEACTKHKTVNYLNS